MYSQTIATILKQFTPRTRLTQKPNRCYYFTMYDTIVRVGCCTRYLERVNENKDLASRDYGKSVINDTRDILVTRASRIVAQRNYLSLVRENRDRTVFPFPPVRKNSLAESFIGLSFLGRIISGTLLQRLDIYPLQ